jgi:hypothetical protein
MPPKKKAAPAATEEIDPASLKVTDLKAELTKRGLDTKVGYCSLL